MPPTRNGSLEARDKVTQYVHENVSPMLRTGEPRLDTEAGLWHVPVLTETAGRLVVLGTYVLDGKMRFIRNPVKQIMDRYSDHLSGGAMEGFEEVKESQTGEAELGQTVTIPRPLAEHAADIGVVDPLTGLGTPAAFLVRLAQDIERLGRYQVPFCVAFLDVEDLWDVNLTHGPLVADALVAQVGRAIEGATRGSDFIAHWAGGRFALLLQGPKDEVLIGCERILAAVRSMKPVLNEGDEPLAVSANLGGTARSADKPDASAEPPDIIKEARGMLMAAKASADRRPMLS
jgi:diguanylate cyclase (GGDEF)-like protein